MADEKGGLKYEKGGEIRAVVGGGGLILEKFEPFLALIWNAGGLLGLSRVRDDGRVWEPR